MQQPKTFSIIIPTFNSEKTLETSLLSISEQTFKDVEVLIMDAKSTDETLSIAKSFANRIPSIKIFSEEDKGIYDGMNKGIEAATGKWGIFLGSDDSFYNKSVLESVNEVILKTNAKVIYGNAHIIGDTGWAKDGDIYAGEFDVHKLLQQNICHQAMFYNLAYVRKEIGDFNLNYKKSSDWDFNLRCWAKQPFQYMNLTVANFLAGGVSTKNSDMQFYDDFIDNVLKYFNINVFDPILDNPSFIYYNKLVGKQRKDYPIRFIFEKYKKRFMKKLRRK